MSLHDLTPNAGHTPLTLAIQSQQLELVEWICENHPAALQVKAPHLPLPTACGLAANSSVKPALVKLLLHHSLLAVSDAGDDGHQALDRAALVGDSAVVDHLISVAHAKPTIQTVVAALSGQNGDSIARIAASWRSMEGATFDHLLRIFILASSQSQWSLLHHLLMMTEAAVDPVATWIRRAASCCLIMHRAAAANQMEVVKLLLRQGVPADLVVVEIPGTKSPIWYAAIHGALDSFLALVLHLPPTQSCLPALFQHRATKVALNCLSLPLHSIETTDVVRIDGCEACTWRNLSGLSCYQTDATKPLRIIHRCIQYWIAHIQQQPQNQDNQTLLHLVAKSGDLATVQAVVQSGASLEAMNNYMQSPAMIVAQRRDVTGTRVLEFMWPMLSEDQKAKACQACTQVDPLNLATLRFCLQETKFCKEMTYASSIMSGNKPAVDLLLAPAHALLETLQGEPIAVVAAKFGAFRIVSWLLLTLNMTPPAVQALVSSDGCTLVHYAALHNQLAFLASNTCLSQCINTKDSYAPAWKVINPRHVNLRTWNFPTSSLLEFATATGLATTVSFVMSVLRYLPMLCAGTLDVRQRIFMSAVSLNHVDVVDILLTSDVIHVIEDPLDHTQIQCQYFGDFVDIAIQHSAHRGLEAMTLCLLRHWKGSVGLGHGKDTESTADFAFQFAVVLQYACIFGRVNLIRHLVARGGSTILGYRVDEGPALVYAFAFGQLGT
ncbi:hypothetical protein DYB32_000925 [Aphanomyces invadans]|uniref:Uncharacterized protein n=1 Tax=Aphanomyces invadans TaxID=157072 RepID=A0A3R6YFV6_9STRA|nr:hypothetical protein DYB32_000925 [Aphanomyces invadans]